VDRVGNLARFLPPAVTHLFSIGEEKANNTARTLARRESLPLSPTAGSGRFPPPLPAGTPRNAPGLRPRGSQARCPDRVSAPPPLFANSAFARRTQSPSPPKPQKDAVPPKSCKQLSSPDLRTPLFKPLPSVL
jgi:hypothetical protein